MTNDFFSELSFQTTRSGGKGGQHVNKVETAVIASFHIASSQFFTAEQKELLLEKLSNRVNTDGYLQVKAQVHRTQLANKEEAIEKLEGLIKKALEKKKPRIATRASAASRQKRLDWKKKNAEIKSGRQKLRPGSFE